jgi:hypothetical protein
MAAATARRLRLLEFLAHAELDLDIFSTDESGDLAGMNNQA